MLGYSPITALGEEPRRWIVFIHGILGRRANWRGIGKRLVQLRPDCGALLVDLRKHGDSVAFEPPHTVKAAALDIVSLVSELKAPVEVIVGHSFGGKVALAYVQQVSLKPKQVWTLDSAPGRVPNPSESQAAGVLRFLKQAPTQYAQREDFIGYAIQEGMSQGVATWLAMNLQRDESQGFVLAIDLEAIEGLMRDYGSQDFWPLIEAEGSEVDIHLVIANRSQTYEETDRARAQRIAQTHSNVHVHTLDTGHWLHVEEPEQLVELLTLGMRDVK